MWCEKIFPVLISLFCAKGVSKQEGTLIHLKCSFYTHFQFSVGVRNFLHIVCVAMAAFAEGYHKHKMSSMTLATVSFMSSGKYTVNPEMRAKQIVKVTQKTNMEFCKAFWSLTEGYGLQVH